MKFIKRGGLNRIAIDLAREGERYPDAKWEQIERLPDWAYKRMKRKHKNRVHGKHHVYKKEGAKFYKKGL